jgi:hypothetical protein
MKKSLRGLGVVPLREYFSKQHPIRCAIWGHVFSGLLLPDMREECLRCGGTWRMFNHPPSLFEWYVIRPIAPIRRAWSIWRYNRWCRKNKRWFV